MRLVSGNNYSISIILVESNKIYKELLIALTYDFIIRKKSKKNTKMIAPMDLWNFNILIIIKKYRQ